VKASPQALGHAGPEIVAYAASFRLVAEHTSDDDARTAMLLYVATLTACAVVFNLIWRHTIRRGLLIDGVDPAFRRHVDIRYRAGLGGYVTATLLALIHPMAHPGRDRSSRAALPAWPFPEGRLPRPITDGAVRPSACGDDNIVVLPGPRLVTASGSSCGGVGGRLPRLNEFDSVLAGRLAQAARLGKPLAHWLQQDDDQRHAQHAEGEAGQDVVHVVNSGRHARCRDEGP